MKKYKDIVYQKLDIDDIVCNLCGNRIQRNQYGYFDDYISIDKTWGFGSEFDNETHHVDLCQKCYKEIFDNFKFIPFSTPQ